MRDMPESHYRKLDDLQQVVTYRLARLQARLNSQAGRRLKSCTELSLTQWRLVAAMQRLGQTTLAEISHATQIDKGQLSRAISALLDAGLIASEADRTDNRKHLLSLTEAGLREHEAIEPVMRDRSSALVADFDEAELAAFFRSLDKIDAAVKRQDGA